MAQTPKILVIDDEAKITELIRDLLLLEHPEWRVESCADGREGFVKLASDDFDVVISDIRMPGMTGLTLLKAIRECGNHCPFIFLTAYAEHDLLIEALKLGAFDFLEKGDDNGMIVKTVEQAVGYSLGMREFEEETEQIIGSAAGFGGDRARTPDLSRSQLLRYQEARKRVWQLRYQHLKKAVK